MLQRVIVVLAVATAVVLGSVGAASRASADMVTGFIPAAGMPGEAVVTPDGSRLYVLSTSPAQIWLVDAATGAPVGATIPLPLSFPSIACALASDADLATLYAAKCDVTGGATAGAILVVDPSSSVITTYATGTSNVTGLAPTPDGGAIWFTSAEGLSEFDLTSHAVVRTISTFAGDDPADVVLSADGTTAYVALYATKQIATVDLASGATARIALPAMPNGLGLTPDGTRLFIGTSGTELEVLTLATGTVTETLTPGGSSLTTTAFNAAGTLAYTVSRGSNLIDITAVDAAPVLTGVTAPSGTVGAAYAGAISATGTPAPTFSLASGSLPPGLALDAATGAITGTPTTAGTYSFTVDVTNTVSGVATTRSATGTITIAASVAAPSDPAELAATGVDPFAPLAVGAALLLLGALIAFVGVRRRRVG